MTIDPSGDAALQALVERIDLDAMAIQDGLMVQENADDIRAALSELAAVLTSLRTAVSGSRGQEQEKLNPNKVGLRVRCSTCGRTKKPIGRSEPLGVDYCDYDCTGYTEAPFVGSLWPGESETDFGYYAGERGVYCSPDSAESPAAGRDSLADAGREALPAPENKSIKRRDTPEQREYWDFIERAAQQSRDRQPAWAKDVASRPPAETPGWQHRFRGRIGADVCMDCGEYREHINHGVSALRTRSGDDDLPAVPASTKE